MEVVCILAILYFLVCLPTILVSANTTKPTCHETILGNGVTYNGNMNITKYGHTCIPWANATNCPHNPFVKGDELKRLEHNYCRNPDNSAQPWCYTDADKCTKEYCDNCKAKCTSFSLTDKDVEKIGDGSTSEYVEEDKMSFRTIDEQCQFNTHCLSSGQWSPFELTTPNHALQHPRVSCPPGSKFRNGFCFLFLKWHGSINLARAVCKLKLGVVAYPESQEDIIFLANLKENSNYVGEGFWSGISHRESDGKYVTQHGSIATYFNWDDNSNSSNNVKVGDCVKITDSLKMKTESCHSSLPVICQIEPTYFPHCANKNQGNVVANNMCYSSVDKKETFLKAQAYCELHYNGIVAPVESKEDNDLLAKVRLNDAEIWLGMNDGIDEGTFITENGKRVNFTNWSDGEPNNYQSSENCVVMRFQDKKWNDVTCATEARFVCATPLVTCADKMNSYVIPQERRKVPWGSGESNNNNNLTQPSNESTSSGDFNKGCKIEVGDASVIINSNKTNIDVDESVGYKCGDGYTIMSGDEIRQCQKDGTLTGKQIQCQKMMDIGTEMVGVSDLFNGTQSLPALISFFNEGEMYKIKHDGIISAWEFYGDCPLPISFQVWRHSKSSSYELVGQNVFMYGPGSVHRYDVPGNKRITVVAGDLVGTLISGDGAIKFTPCQNQTNVGEIRFSDPVSSVTSVKVNEIQIFNESEGSCVLFPFRAIVVKA